VKPGKFVLEGLEEQNVNLTKIY